MVFEHPLFDSIKISSWCYNFFPFPGEWNANILPSDTRWWDWL